MKMITSASWFPFARIIFAILIVMGLIAQVLITAQAGTREFSTQTEPYSVVKAGDNSSPGTTSTRPEVSTSVQQVNMVISALAIALILMTIWILRWLDQKSMMEIPLEIKNIHRE